MEQGLAVQEWGDPADPAILLWPGLGSTGAYFDGIAEALPGRTFAVDPPGSGRSAPLDRYTSDALIERAADVAEAYGCRAIVGHSLGAYVAVGLAADPPAGLRAAVLLDGGFMDAAAMAELGMPVTSGREQLIGWMRAHRLRFPDWETATRELAGIIGGEPTEMVEAYVRDVFAEVDGEIRERISPEEAADQVLAVVEHDVLSSRPSCPGSDTADRERAASRTPGHQRARLATVHRGISADRTARRGRLGPQRHSSRPRSVNALDRGLAPTASLVEVLDDLTSARPLLGRYDEVDVASAEAIERVVCRARGVDAELTEPVAPGQGARLILERADRLPAVQARIANGHRWVVRPTGLAETAPGHPRSVGPVAGPPGRRSAGVAHAGSDAVDRQQKRALGAALAGSSPP